MKFPVVGGSICDDVIQCIARRNTIRMRHPGAGSLDRQSYYLGPIPVDDQVMREAVDVAQLDPRFDVHRNLFEDMRSDCSRNFHLRHIIIRFEWHVLPLRAGEQLLNAVHLFLTHIPRAIAYTSIAHPGSSHNVVWGVFYLIGT